MVDHPVATSRGHSAPVGAGEDGILDPGEHGIKDPGELRILDPGSVCDHVAVRQDVFTGQGSVLTDVTTWINS